MPENVPKPPEAKTEYEGQLWKEFINRVYTLNQASEGG